MQDAAPNVDTSIRTRRDVLAAGVLFLATAGFVFWQNSQVAVLWDLGYLLDTSYRISLGQIPYRDFPLVHPPLTFLIQAAIIRLAGPVYFFPVLYAAVIGGLGSIVAWRIVLRTLGGAGHSKWWTSLLLSAPLVFLGIYSIYPHPIYDCDSIFAVLVSVFLLQRVSLRSSPAEPVLVQGWLFPFVAGAAAVFPVFFKQNIGLPYLLAVVLALLLCLVLQTLQGKANSQPTRAATLFVLAGIAAALLIAVGLIQETVGVGAYLRWTVHFAAERRLPELGDLASVYTQPSLVWSLPCLGAALLLLNTKFAKSLYGQLAAIALFLAPFVWCVLYLLLNEDADERADNLLTLWPLLLLVAAACALIALRREISLGRLLPFCVLAAIHGTFLSQQLWGSTYAIWPLLILLIAGILAEHPTLPSKLTFLLASGIGLTLFTCGSLYAVSHERLNYVQIPDEPLHRSSVPALRGMADRGSFIPNFDKLIEFVSREVPTNESVLTLPGEDPFYYATGRVPQFPVTLFDRTTDPYSPSELAQEARNRGIQWVIVKRDLQLTENPLPEREKTMQLIEQDYQLFQRLAGYDIYRH